MKNHLLFVYLLLIIYSCDSEKSKKTSLVDFVPENSSYILKVSSFENFKSSFNNNDFIQKLSKSPSYKNLNNQLEVIAHLNLDEELLICFSKDLKDNMQFSVISKMNDSLFKTDSLNNIITDSIQFNNKTITKSIINELTIFSTLIDNILITSSSIKIIENSFNHYNNKSLENSFKIVNESNSFSVVITSSNLEKLFINDSLSLEEFTDHLELDVDMQQNEVLLNGITKADSTKLITVFKNTIPQENKLAKITPSNADGFTSFTFNDFYNFKKNLDLLTEKDSILTEITLFDNIIEVGTISSKNNKIVVLNSLDEYATKDALINEQELVENFRQVEIYKFSQPKLFSATFSPLITFSEAHFYCVIDNFFIFGKTLDELQNIIANYQNKTTLIKRDYFKEIEQNLSNESSLLIVVNSAKLKTVLNNSFNEQITSNFNDYKASAIQFIYDTNFAHVNAVLKKTKVKAIENSISEEFNLKLDAELLNNPQFVVNHRTKQKEIVVQDINNNLYLISNRGKVLFKKQLHGAILGKIEQIDIFKNGRLQLVFATSSRVYLLDRNGKDVPSFPMKFQDEITQPLSVFNYDKKKNYRLLVTQGKNSLMYDAKGKIVKGFNFKSANNLIINQPQHFRVSGKDYIVLKTKNKLYILDRKGNERITPKKQNNYSAEAVYFYKNAFATTSKNGDLILMDLKGNSTSQKLNLSTKHYIQATSKTLVSQTENKLSIKGKTTNLDFGNYTQPKLFYLNDKIYVSITDNQAGKIYLFDSQSNLLPNFPIYGNSSIELNNIDKDRNLEFVTKGDNNSVILYQIN